MSWIRNTARKGGGGHSPPPGVVGHDGKEGEGDEEADVGIGAHHLVQPLRLGLSQKPAQSVGLAQTSRYDMVLGSVVDPDPDGDRHSGRANPDANPNQYQCHANYKVDKLHFLPKTINNLFKKILLTLIRTINTLNWQCGD
jgi:hypothetical protein